MRSQGIGFVCNRIERNPSITPAMGKHPYNNLIKMIHSRIESTIEDEKENSIGPPLNLTQVDYNNYTNTASHKKSNIVKKISLSTNIHKRHGPVEKTKTVNPFELEANNTKDSTITNDLYFSG